MNELEELLPDKKSSSRNPGFALLLSLLTPGLGQIYNGQLIKGILIFVLSILLPAIWGQTRLTLSFYGLIIIILIQLSFWIWVISDAVVHSKKQKNYSLRPYNTWYFHLLFAGAMISLMYFIDIGSLLRVRSFQISSTSQSPTLLPGDFIIADMSAYESNSISYGDIVVFNGPTGEYWTFRVVGLPNDRIAIRNGIVEANGTLNKTTLLVDTLIVESFGIGDPTVSEYSETLPNGHAHRLHKYNGYDDSKYRNVSSTQIPENQYYLLGDNRDNAEDSRIIGLIHAEDIVGRVIYSYWGRTTDRINIDFRDK